METINLGIGDDLPPVDWSTIVERIADGSPPAPDANNARTTWLTTLNEDGSPHVTQSVRCGRRARSGSRRARPHGRAAMWHG